VGGVLLAVAAACVGQDPRPSPTGSVVPPSVNQPAAAPALEPHTVAKDKSIDELLSRLDAIKAQQEELEKAKKETVALLKERLKQQKQRLQKLGVNVEEETPPPPVVTGQ
jgi:hypothetical protein